MFLLCVDIVAFMLVEAPVYTKTLRIDFVEMLSDASWLKSPRSPEGTLSKGEIFSRSTSLLEERVLSHLADEGCQLHLNLTRVDNEDWTRRKEALQGRVGRLGDL